MKSLLRIAIFRLLFYHDEADFCLLGNDGDNEVRANGHPVWFGLSIEIASALLFSFFILHDEAHFCLLGNDGDEGLRASWHPVVFGLKIEVSSEKMVLFYGIRVPGIHRCSSLNNR